MNEKLLKVATPKDFEALGFKFENDGTDSPWGNSWEMSNEKFNIYIDPTFEVNLYRLDEQTDCIKVQIDDLYELQRLIDFIQIESTVENPIYKREKIPDDFDPFQKILIEMKLPSGITKYIEGNIHVASKFKGYTGYCLKRIN